MAGWLLLAHHNLWILEASELFSWLVKKSPEKWPLGRPRRREDNIKMGHAETDCDDWMWTELAKIASSYEIWH
jgi:hypothetical protein